jgi:extensin-like protein
MVRGVRWYLVRSCGPALLLALAGCGGWLFAEREPWRRDAEVACFNSGAIQEGPGRVRIAAINGPGICGADFPLKVSLLGAGEVLGYGDEMRPPSAIPNAALPRALLGRPPYDPRLGAPQPEPSPPGVEVNRRLPSLESYGAQDHAPYPYGGAPRLGPSTVPLAAGPVSVNPPATLACPVVSTLDRWIANSVQGSALRWFSQPVVEIKQISAYSCRGMNGDPHAQISEHAFGNALDIAAFTLADGRRITVKDGWNGAPEEQGFLRDVQAAACEEFTTVLAPGSNAYHYDHIHLDLMRRASGHRACDPGAVSGQEVAARARARFGGRTARDPAVTGSVRRPSVPVRPLPAAMAGADGLN